MEILAPFSGLSQDFAGGSRENARDQGRGLVPLWPGPAVGVSGAIAVGLKLLPPPGFTPLSVGSTEWLVVVSVDFEPPHPVRAAIAVTATATATTSGRRLG